jgi:hypothetical protein
MSQITSEELSAAAGILLSLGFSYIPGLRRRFAALDPTGKRLVMLALLAACALGVFALGCLGAGLLPALPCDQSGLWGLVRVFVAALVANQAAFSLSPQLDAPPPPRPSSRRTPNPALARRAPPVRPPQDVDAPRGEKLLIRRPAAPSPAPPVPPAPPRPDALPAGGSDCGEKEAPK